MKEVIPGVLGVRVIKGEELLVLLRRVEAGEHPNHVFAEYWAEGTRLEGLAEGEGER